MPTVTNCAFPPLKKAQFVTALGIILRMLFRIGRILDIVSILIVLIIAGGSDSPRFTGVSDRARVYTREIEFDYPNWVWGAAWTKLEQSAIDSPHIFERGTNKQTVLEYFRITRQLIQTENRIAQIFADPNILDKDNTSAFLRAQRDKLIERQKILAPFAESNLQSQVAEALSQLGLTTSGQPLPPVLYQISSTPLALIISEREHIEQTANISILPTLTLDEQVELEDKIAKSLDVSTLVVPIGGVGVYPTMVMETTDLPWTLSTIAHEWTHNYLNVRPLGLNYATTPELRTMNETTASIVGEEVGHLAQQIYYPETLASSPSRNLISFNNFFLPVRATLHRQPDTFLSPGGSPLLSPSNNLDDPPPFDFRAEMHETRVKADELLADGKIEEAETYMEARRQIFWNNGYLIRKLNQAYFAFNGAYADVPGGAAGEDPVGPAVRALREKSDSLADFINTIAWMISFDQLKQSIEQ